MSRLAFRFGDVFPDDDVLAEWVATLALAMNDVSLVRAKLRDDVDVKYKWLYWHRLGIAHFAEAASYLRDTAEIAEVDAFVRSLDEEVQRHYRDCLGRYERHESGIEQIRNHAGFHYPELKIVPGQKRKRLMQRVLAALSDKTGEIALGTIREGRSLFADEIASAVLVNAIGGEKALKGGPADFGELVEGIVLEIEEGIGSFARFANGAIDTYLVRRNEGGAIQPVEASNASEPEASGAA